MIKPIRNPDDLSRARIRLAELIQANHQGAFTDEIEVLSTLAEQYEKAGNTVSVLSPVAAIKFRMGQAGMVPRQLEPYIGSRARVSEVLSGKRQLTLDMIRSLHEGLGIPYESLISRGQQHAIPTGASEAAVERLNTFGFDLRIEQVPQFVREAHGAPRALHRKTRTQRTASKTDLSALMLWQAAVMSKATDRPVSGVFCREVFTPEALRKLARLSARPDGPKRAVHMLAEYGVSTVVLPALPGTFLDGAAMADLSGRPVIGLTLRYDRTDNFWFTLLHEASHISLHFDQLIDSGEAFVDDMEIRSEDSSELEADALARDSLIPPSILAHVRWDAETTHDDIIALSARARVHVSIAAGRWQRDHQNYKKFSRLIERDSVRSLLGGDSTTAED